jgi:hypothetical protein
MESQGSPARAALAGAKRPNFPLQAPRPRTYENVDSGASTPEATPWLYVAGADGTATAKT